MKRGKLDHISKPNPDKEALKKAKLIEKKKNKKGYRWMQKGKTKIHAHPDRLQKYLDEGFSFM